MIFVALAFFALVLAGTWYLYGRMVDAITAPQPTTVQLEEPNEAQFTAANEKLRRLEDAAAAQETVTVEFTAAELNALIARHPDYTDLRGKVRVEIADSIATLDLSVPLSGVPLPRIRQRWFTGSASFGLVYDNGDFTFSPQSIIANDYELAEDLFRDLTPTFNNYFNQEWDSPSRSSRKRGDRVDIWPQIRSLVVDDDRVVVTTKGRAAPATAPAATATPTPADEPALGPEE